LDGQEPLVLDVTLAGWAATIGLIAVLFAIDLFVSRPGHAQTVGFREAVIASVFYVSVALAFGVVFGLIAGLGVRCGVLRRLCRREEPVGSRLTRSRRCSA
jgi:hypothetical protein